MIGRQPALRPVKFRWIPLMGIGTIVILAAFIVAFVFLTVKR